MALFKVVLLNLSELRRLGVEHIPDLQRYEDIALNHQVLQCKDRGGTTLECQSFCFSACAMKAGGCSQ